MSDGLLIGFSETDEFRGEICGSAIKRGMSGIRWHRPDKRNQWRQLFRRPEGQQVHRDDRRCLVSRSYCRRNKASIFFIPCYFIIFEFYLLFYI